jgi:hypothetical protein
MMGINRMFCVCVLAACATEMPTPDALPDEPSAPRVTDLAIDAFPAGMTSDGYLVVRRWSGQGLVLEAMPAEGGAAISLGAITREDSVLVSGGVVGWWAGEEQRFHYWTSSAGLRASASERSSSQLLYGSEDGSHVVYATNVASTHGGDVGDIVFESTADWSSVVVAEGIYLHVAGVARAVITNDGRLVALVKSETTTVLAHVDGEQSWTMEVPEHHGLDVDEFGTTALLTGHGDAIGIELRTRRVTPLGNVDGRLVDGRMAIVRERGQPGLLKVELGESVTRRPIFVELGAVDVRTLPTSSSRQWVVLAEVATTPIPGSRQWLGDLYTGAARELTDRWAQFTESAESLVYSVPSDASDEEYVASVFAEATDGGASGRPILDGISSMYVPSTTSHHGSTASRTMLGENVIGGRHHCLQCTPELWYANARTGASGKLSSASTTPPPLLDMVYAHGHRLFYVEHVNGAWMLRAAELP